MSSKFSDILFRSGLTASEQIKIKDSIQNENKKNLVFAGGFSAIMSIMLVISSIITASGMISTAAYLFTAVFSAILLIFSISLCKKVKALTTPLSVLFSSIMLLTGAILGSTAYPDQNAITYLMFIFIIPLITKQKPIITYIIIITSALAFSILKIQNAVFDDIIKTDIAYTVILSIISCVISTLVAINSSERIVLKANSRTKS